MPTYVNWPLMQYSKRLGQGMRNRLHQWQRRVAIQTALRRAHYARPQPVQTVCLALGPYRNLTTLTAAMIALHPQCQVLNHGGKHILGNPQLDFLVDPSPSRLEAFIRAAIQLSRGGMRGDEGGSLLFSHAFDPQYQARTLYQQRFGEQRVKEEIRVLFWKESLRISNHLRNHAVDVAQLLARQPKLKFLLPVRHPLDCAVSNLKEGHVRLLLNGNHHAPPEQVVEQILDELLWVQQLCQQQPERFFVYFAHAFEPKTVTDLAHFLGVEADAQWQRDACALFHVARSYQHSAALIEFYQAAVQRKFAADPTFARALLRFVESADAAL